MDIKSNLYKSQKKNCLNLIWCLFYLGDYRLDHSIISRNSKKQTTLAFPFVESEYRALVASTRDLQWISFLLYNLDRTSVIQFIL